MFTALNLWTYYTHTHTDTQYVHESKIAKITFENDIRDIGWFRSTYDNTIY